MPKIIKSKTQSGITRVLSDLRVSLAGVAARDGDLVAVQCATFLFAGNPVAMISDAELLTRIAKSADAVRDRAMTVIGAHGGQAERVIGDERTWLAAAEQALVRLQGLVDAGRDMVTRLNDEHMAELRAKTDLTPEENAQLAALRADWLDRQARAAVPAVNNPG